jgi:hypothetical protein
LGGFFFILAAENDKENMLLKEREQKYINIYFGELVLETFLLSSFSVFLFELFNLILTNLLLLVHEERERRILSIFGYTNFL